MASLTARSALADLHGNGRAARFDNGAAALEELALLGLVRLQGPAADADFCAQVAAALMPLAPAGRVVFRDTAQDNDAAQDNQVRRCQWLAPNEWLLVTAPGAEGEVLELLAPILPGRLALATPISDSGLAVAVSGACAAELLAKGCALDLHRRQFGVGNAAVTRFAGVAAVISRTAEQRYELYVERPQAHYIWEWLVDAAGEFAG